MAKAHRATQAAVLFAMCLICTPSYAIDGLWKHQTLDDKVTIDRFIQPPRWRGCDFYDTSIGKGASLRVRVSGVDSLSDGTKVWATKRPTLQPDWNNRISSLKCDPECSASISLDENYGGNTMVAWNPTNLTFLDSRWNNKVSSLSVFCRMSTK